MPLLRKGSKGFDQEFKSINEEGQFACFCPEDFSLQSDKVSDIEVLKVFEGLVPYSIFLDISLDPSFSILNLNKAGFPEVPDRHDPSREREMFADGLEFLLRLGTVGLMNLRGGMRYSEIVGERINPFLPQDLQFSNPLLDQLI